VVELKTTSWGHLQHCQRAKVLSQKFNCSSLNHLWRAAIKAQLL